MKDEMNNLIIPLSDMNVYSCLAICKRPDSWLSHVQHITHMPVSYLDTSTHVSDFFNLSFNTYISDVVLRLEPYCLLGAKGIVLNQYLSFFY